MGFAEGWRPVGADGEPDFEALWTNAGTGADVSFRLAHAGEVAIFGAAHYTAGAGAVIFTLPEGYRPASGRIGWFPVSMLTALTTFAPAMAVIEDDGDVSILAQSIADDTVVYLNGEFPIDLPAVA